MSLQGEADELARELFETRTKLRAAGRALHDHVGPLLSAAGIRLDLLRADHSGAAGAIRDVITPLEEAMERIRAMSRDLNPPPGAHLSLKKALDGLVEVWSEQFRGTMQFDYSAAAVPPDAVAAAIYEAAAAALARLASDFSASKISVRAGGAKSVTVKIVSNGKGRWPRAMWQALARRAVPAGVTLAATTKKGTIVSIRYAIRRPTGG